MQEVLVGASICRSEILQPSSLDPSADQGGLSPAVDASVRGAAGGGLPSLIPQGENEWGGAWGSIVPL